MATGKYGAIITDMKGKVGGTIFKGTKSGAVIQNKQISTAGRSDGGKLTKADAGRVILTQRNLGQVATQWRELADVDRAAWIAAAPDFPFTNKFGDAYTGSGYQLYMQCNSNLLNIGEPVIDVPPSPAAVENCPSFTVDYDPAGAGHFEIDGTIPAGYNLTLYATGNISAGRMPQYGMFKAVAVIPTAAVFPYEFTSGYHQVFGSIPVSGNVWFQGWVTEKATGRMGQPFNFQLQY